MIKVYKFLQKKDRFNAMNEKDRENSSKFSRNIKIY